MSRILRYLSHPQVEIDRAVSVPQWGLSAFGRQRLEQIDFSKVLANTKIVVSSTEVKAVETATLICDPLSLTFNCREAMHENDRSATGFLPPEEFEQVADQFFAKPSISVRGWEKAIDAQSRIVGETMQVIKIADSGDILLVGHGAVGTLLFCHFADEAIHRKFDQIGGGGNFFSIDLETALPLHGWKPIEQI